MVDHMTHYIHDILARFLVDYIGLARLFPWVTANLVSFAGVFLAIVGSKLTVSDSLLHRQVGAVLFECRNLADSLDGVFARAGTRQQATNRISEKTAEITYSSVYGSLGYNVDVICDIIGGAFFCLAIFYRFLRRKPTKKVLKASESDTNQSIANYKYSKLETSDSIKSDCVVVRVDGADVSAYVKEAFELYPSNNQPSCPSPRHFSSRQVKMIVISFGLRILITGGLWDRFVHQYHDLLENYSNDPAVRYQQGVAFRSINMWLIMWSWRLINGCALLEHLVFATVFDRLWEYLVFTAYIGWAVLGTLAILTQLHYNELYNSLNGIAA